ncbi:MAG: hypothetical protein AABX52_01355 [Nanoarchaeota archaeon]
MIEHITSKSRFHDIVWSELEGRITPREIRRHVQLACVLEPVAEKEGCTTRSTNLSKYQKLEYFLTAGVNIGDAFEDLAHRIYNNGFPCQTYDLCYRAQADSKKNRRGGRINQGIIEFLFPLVISHVSYQLSSPHDIIQAVPAILNKTMPEDTLWLQKMQNLAFEMSGYSHRTFAPQEDTNILSYYKRRLKDSIKPSDTYHNHEIVTNYPTLRFMIEQLSCCSTDSLSQSMQYVYNEVHRKKPEMPLGIIADLTACLIYLKLGCERTSKLVR